jgi:hypothetical protein
MPSPTLPSEAVLAELEKVLSSGVFRGASRSSRLLRFLVEETLAGNGDGLKDYTLGSVALGRGDDFDPRTDPIARVEASRLRARLELYYALFYVTLDGQLVSVPMRFSRDTNTWGRGTPDTLFPIPIGPVQDYSRLYVVSRDGQRFLVDTLVEGAAEPIIVLLNWKPGS